MGEKERDRNHLPFRDQLGDPGGRIGGVGRDLTEYPIIKNITDINMQILLASAKIMNAATSVDIPMKSKPKFQEQAGLFALELSTWDTNRLMKELKCSQAIALENQQRYQSFWNEEELLPSILAYYGQAYKYLQADNFSQDDFAFAQDHLFITSFLYGLLRPLDMIHPL